MAVNDPVADFLTRIRNALRAQHDSVVIPSSKLKVELARILRERGYIEQRASVISGIKRVSTPGRRTYVHSGEIPKILGGMGTTIISTSRGVMTGHEANREGVGGEVVAYVW